MTNILTLPAERFAEYETRTILELEAEFRRLDRRLDDQDYETRKLIILKVIEEHLRTQFHIQTEAPAPINSQTTRTYQQTLLKCAYQFCMVFGFFEKAAGSFLFGSNLFALIPGIGPVSLYTLTAIYSLLDALLFYAFEVSLLKKAMGIIFSDNGACVLNETYVQQLEAANEINMFLNRRETVDWDPVTYQQYCVTLESINHHLLKKHLTMGAYPRTKLRMAVEYAVVLFGAISTIADSYFMAKTAMLALHISFMSSPLACALVIAMVASALVFYYAMGARGVAKLVNPDRKSFYKLKEGLTLFSNRHRDLGGGKPYVPHGVSLPAVTPFSPTFSIASG